jgi:hypothetical protein
MSRPPSKATSVIALTWFIFCAELALAVEFEALGKAAAKPSRHDQGLQQEGLSRRPRSLGSM